ncbi:MAG: hypothetical protein ACRDYY_02415 [Acidimicrobiales bacterium]
MSTTGPVAGAGAATVGHLDDHLTAPARTVWPAGSNYSNSVATGTTAGTCEGATKTFAVCGEAIPPAPSTSAVSTVGATDQLASSSRRRSSMVDGL